MMAKYKNPPIPMGYRYVGGAWNNGFTIERIFDGSKFTWVPVGALSPNGTLNGTDFNQKFGRRRFKNEDYSENGYKEVQDKEFYKMLESVEKFDGFYISSYNISRSPSGRPQSKKDEWPWTKVTLPEAKEIAMHFEYDIMVKSHLPYPSEIDTMNQWFIDSGARTYEEMAVDSTKIGNCYKSGVGSLNLMKTGAREKWSTNGIFDHTGNCQEWTQEYGKGFEHITRGADFSSLGSIYTAVSRSPIFGFHASGSIGFRITLCIDPKAQCTYVE